MCGHHSACWCWMTVDGATAGSRKLHTPWASRIVSPLYAPGTRHLLVGVTGQLLCSLARSHLCTYVPCTAIELGPNGADGVSHSSSPSSESQQFLEAGAGANGLSLINSSHALAVRHVSTFFPFPPISTFLVAHNYCPRPSLPTPLLPFLPTI